MALTETQWQFIAHRLLCATDKEAAEKVGIHPITVANWKQSSEEFVTEYQAAFSDGIHVAQEYTRKLLGKAAQRLSESLEAVKTISLAVDLEPDTDGGKKSKQFVPIEVPDYPSRLKAVELIFKTHGLLTEKRDVNMSGTVTALVPWAPKEPDGNAG